MTAKRSRRSRPPQRARAPVQRRSSVPLFAAAIAIVGIWAYATSFTGVFVLDDVRAIVRNETIRTLWPPTGPLAPPTGSTVAGRPVANLSFAINYALAPSEAQDSFTPGWPGDGPSSGAFLQNVWGYHLGNLLVHLAAALTLFGVVRRTLMTPRLAERFGGIAAHVACTVALVWGVHLLTTESVTYLVQRVESLMGLFYLLTLYCAIRAEDDASRRLLGRHAQRAARDRGSHPLESREHRNPETAARAPEIRLRWGPELLPTSRASGSFPRDPTRDAKRHGSGPILAT